MLARAGWRLGRVGVLVTDHAAFVKSVLKRRGNPLATALSYPLSAALLLRERVTRTAAPAGDVEVRSCANFDERFDDFWVAMRRRHPNLLLAVRTREVLAWHFKYALAENRAWIATISEGARLIAYAVFDRRYRKDIDLQQMRMVDFQALDGGSELLPPIIGWALRKCSAEGIRMLETVGRWLERGECLNVIAPYRRKLSWGWPPVYRANNARLAADLRKSSFVGAIALRWRREPHITMCQDIGSKGRCCRRSRTIHGYQRGIVAPGLVQAPQAHSAVVHRHRTGADITDLEWQIDNPQRQVHHR
jgi:hypothetical protein